MGDTVFSTARAEELQEKFKQEKLEVPLAALRDVSKVPPADGQVLTYDATAAEWKPAAGGGGGGTNGHVIEDEGTPLPQRANLNFTGAGVSVADAGSKTVVTIPGGGGGGVENFIELGDAPASYTGQSGKLVAVKGDESGVEFVDASGGAAYPDRIYLAVSPGTIPLSTAQQGIINSVVEGVTFELPTEAPDGATYKFMATFNYYLVSTGGKLILNFGSSSFRVHAGQRFNLVAYNTDLGSGMDLLWFVTDASTTFAADWHSTNRYMAGQLARYESVVYISLTANNFNQQPDTSPAYWFPLAGAGEANEGANAGSGVGVFRDKTGVTLNFRSLRAGANINITEDGDEVEISADDSPLSTEENTGSIDPGNISVSGGTPPTGVTADYHVYRVGKSVLLTVNLSTVAAGSGNTSVEIDLTSLITTPPFLVPSIANPTPSGSVVLVTDAPPLTAHPAGIGRGSGLTLFADFPASNLSAARFTVPWIWNG